jgi:hypothetical protein
MALLKVVIATAMQMAKKDQFNALRRFLPTI